MTDYGIHMKHNDGALYVVNGKAEGYTIMTLIGAQEADTPLNAAKAHIGVQRGKTLIIDEVEALSDNVSRISYHWHVA